MCGIHQQTTVELLKSSSFLQSYPLFRLLTFVEHAARARSTVRTDVFLIFYVELANNRGLGKEEEGEAACAIPVLFVGAVQGRTGARHIGRGEGVVREP